ncbi:tRNA uridine-5-carboxymethylaminomethyl(34) synthesis enzyme MnmG [Simkania negevensis]|uniref:tRNA uridine 5-carboxymethylaminomethyl modification enzyme MnmG n=1 Tax=Simkania negevensis TaxID=83561 RepID=A0ABS3ARI6_9BACT|nr:tRNA uridine-5-carboxymethylaminomethyl(34) synthesis enzyme MnmG [Simkania negevensis]
MWIYPVEYDVIVVGAGHAGCEAAHAAAVMGANTLLLTMNLDTIAKMSCNPAIGGTGKGQIVREIDALGGLMGGVADQTGIQFRMLNRSKGPAVWAPRCQSDRVAYSYTMKHALERVPNLEIKQGTTQSVSVEDGCVRGVETLEGVVYRSQAVIITAGTFMQGLIHIGEVRFAGGRAGDKPSTGLSKCLEELGFRLGRLKTGTPPRINKRSIDFSKVEEQPGEEDVAFSFSAKRSVRLMPQLSCHITYTTQATKEIIQDNLHRSAVYSGEMRGVGPRYCPSIEDKIVRFADKERHQIFLEPEGVHTEEYYVNGISSSLPFEVQLDFLRTIIGLEKAEIMRPAYAIEYDYVVGGQITHSLEAKSVNGLFIAGQVNGTTGYEEAAGQGLVAGINAACKLQGRPSFTLQRSESYIGVMVDDLVTKEEKMGEPYRIFTSRAEYRLLLRQDNADLRLVPRAYEVGMVSKERYEQLLGKQRVINEEKKRLNAIYKQVDGKGASLAQLLRRPSYCYRKLAEEYSEVKNLDAETEKQIEFELKYAGYIERQNKDVVRLNHLEHQQIPQKIDFHTIEGLSSEAKAKLSHVLPSNLGQASRIQGVSPADILVLMVAIKKMQLCSYPSSVGVSD